MEESLASLRLIEYSTFKLGFIGAGNLASCVVKGLIDSGFLPASRIFTAHRNPESRVKFTSLGIKVYRYNHEVVQECDVIVFAVKPQILEQVIRELCSKLCEKKLLVSLAVGIKLAALQEWVGHGRIIRAIPNTASSVCESVTVMHIGTKATKEDRELLSALFRAIGKVWILDEKLSDASAAVGGAGLAFVSIAIEAMADGGVAAGLSRETALGLAAQTFYGAASMVMKLEKHPGQLKDEIASPGGATIAGIHKLEKGAFRAHLMDAVLAAKNRSHELGG